MKKATKVASPINLGIKRSCPRCGIKFYDFGKPEICCPRCDAKVQALGPEGRRIASISPRKHVRSEKASPEDALIESEEIITDDSDPFESVESLDHEDGEVLDDLDPQNDEEKEKY